MGWGLKCWSLKSLEFPMAKDLLFTLIGVPKVFSNKEWKNKRMRSGIDWCKANGVWDVKELPFLPTTRGVWHSDLAILHSKSILRQKEELWKCSRRNQNPLRYHNSITIYLKFQHKPKYIIFQKFSYKNRDLLGTTT